ncbi:MAG: hypothetical protein U5K33_08120 [Halofilum sp. (in: g-proteobacteria)]|nr:hypothetical protein [Halofilum sp. (in: g-proteobacteria)]
MNVSLTEREYRLLLDLLLTADWVIHGHRREEPAAAEPYRMLIQKLLSLAGEFGAEDLVEIDGERNEYRPTERFERETVAWKLLDEYDDLVFWEELIVRLAERDISSMPGKRDIEAMSGEEYDRLAQPLEEKYAGEFFEHGLDRLTLRNS